jgi:hypothetical protein
LDRTSVVDVASATLGEAVDVAREQCDGVLATIRRNPFRP